LTYRQSSGFPWLRQVMWAESRRAHSVTQPTSNHDRGSRVLAKATVVQATTANPGPQKLSTTSVLCAARLTSQATSMVAAIATELWKNSWSGTVSVILQSLHIAVSTLGKQPGSGPLSEPGAPQRIAIAGATGYIGGRLAPRLLEAGHASFRGRRG